MHARSTRRQFLGLAGTAALGASSIVTIRPAEATPAMLAAAIRQVVGAATVQPGKVRLEVPPLVENGNTVPMTVSVVSPMTPEDHVKSIHVFNEKIRSRTSAIFISARLAAAPISTRIRLADSQKVVAIAAMSDGSFWSASVDVVVTLAACTEELI